MTYHVPQSYVPGQVKAACGICGVVGLFPGDFVQGADKIWRCKRFCGPEETRSERDRAIASFRRREAQNPRFVLPPQYTSDCKDVEAIVFRFVCDTAPTDVRATAEACRYLYDLVLENERPLSMVAEGRAKLLSLGDWILTQQSIAADITYGAFLDVGGEYRTQYAARAGYALLRCFQVQADPKYLAGAQRVALFLSRMQNSGQTNVATIQYTSADNPPTVRLDTGAWVAGVVGLPAFIQEFRPGDLCAAEFLSLLNTVEGDTTYGDAPGALMVSDTHATLSTMIAAGRAYWVAAAGFSTATPAYAFSAFPTGTNSWALIGGTSIETHDWALALRSLASLDGLTGAEVASRYAWLMASTSNPAYETPAGASPLQIAQATTGTHDPKLCLCFLLDVFDGMAYRASPMNADSLLDWSCAGLLAPIQDATDQVQVMQVQQAGAPRFDYPTDLFPPDQCRADSVFVHEYCGLSMQPYGWTSRSLYTAACCGALMRQGNRAAPTVRP